MNGWGFTPPFPSQRRDKPRLTQGSHEPQIQRIALIGVRARHMRCERPWRLRAGHKAHPAAAFGLQIVDRPCLMCPTDLMRDMIGTSTKTAPSFAIINLPATYISYGLIASLVGLLVANLLISSPGFGLYYAALFAGLCTAFLIFADVVVIGEGETS